MFVRSDNPVRDQMRYDMDQAEKKPECLHCSVCGASIDFGDDYYEVDDMPYCPDCMDDAFRRTFYESELDDCGDPVQNRNHSVHSAGQSDL